MNFQIKQVYSSQIVSSILLFNLIGLGFNQIGLCINLYPCFIFRNLLPFEVSYKLSNFTTIVGEEKKLAAGDVAEIYDAKVGVGTISVKVSFKVFNLQMFKTSTNNFIFR